MQAVSSLGTVVADAFGELRSALQAVIRCAAAGHPAHHRGRPPGSSPWPTNRYRARAPAAGLDARSPSPAPSKLRAPVRLGYAQLVS
jgi:hypothetical protein